MKKTDINLVSLGLSDPKSPSNVGAVMRAAGCYQANAVFYTGERYNRAVKFQTDTKKIAQQIPLTHVASLLEQVEPEQQIVCVELVEGATPLPLFQHPPKALYIFGPEDGSLSQQIVDQADYVVYIPTIGCMNLAATVNVLLYDRLAKLACDEQSDGDQLIRHSRDNRNRLVKRD